jgi:hypothetical protein
MPEIDTLEEMRLRYEIARDDGKTYSVGESGDFSTDEIRCLFREVEAQGAETPLSDRMVGAILSVKSILGGRITLRGYEHRGNIPPRR